MQPSHINVVFIKYVSGVSILTIRLDAVITQLSNFKIISDCELPNYKVTITSNELDPLQFELSVSQETIMM